MGLFSFLFGGDTPKEKIEYHKKCIEDLKANIESCRRTLAANSHISANQKKSIKNNIANYKKRIDGHKERIADLRKQK